MSILSLWLFDERCVLRQSYVYRPVLEVTEQTHGFANTIIHYISGAQLVLI